MCFGQRAPQSGILEVGRRAPFGDGDGDWAVRIAIIEELRDSLLARVACGKVEELVVGTRRAGRSRWRAWLLHLWQLMLRRIAWDVEFADQPRGLPLAV